MTKQNNSPTLRFPEFQGEWEEKKLGELSDLITKGTTPKKFTSEGVKFIKIECFDGDYINPSKCLFIDEKIHNKELKRSILKAGDILFAIAGATIGKVNFVTKEILPANTNQALSLIRLSIGNSKTFIYHNLKSTKMQKYIVDSISVGAQPNLNLEQINNFSFYLPTLPEQTRIATFLTAVDDKLTQLKKKKSLLEEYKKGVMQKLFSQELRFKDENGDEFAEWEEKKLGEVLIKNSSKNKNQEFKLVQSVSNKYGFVNQDEYFEDRIIASKDLSNYYVIRKGNFAYNPSRIDVGSLAYKYDNDTSVISPLYISFSANSIWLIDSFLLSWFYTQEFTRQMNSSFEGSVRNTLSYESLIKIEINFPSIPEQNKIANFLTSLDDKISHCTSQIEKMEEWKKGLLQGMFV
jgi:type I restriction enzyme S subunit